MTELKTGDRVRLFGPYLNASSTGNKKREKFGTLGRKSGARAWIVKFDDPHDWAAGINPVWEERYMEKFVNKVNVGDDVIVTGTWINSRGNRSTNGKKYAKVMKVAPGNGSHSAVTIKFDDPKDWVVGVNPSVGWESVEKYDKKDLVVKPEIGDRAKIIGGEGPYPNLLGATGVVEKATLANHVSIRLDQEVEGWKSKTVTIMPNNLEKIMPYEDFRQKLFNYLLAKDSDERRDVMADLSERWWWSEKELYNYVANLLDENQNEWCPTGIKNARKALGIPEAVPAPYIAENLQLTFAPGADIQNLLQVIKRNVGLISGVDSVSEFQVKPIK